jgi:ribosome-associated heat shock protein Hsp15
MSVGDDGNDSGRLRIDRWLWCARFFKSRSAAAEAVRGGRVRLNGSRVKPAHDVRIGDAIAVESAGAVRDVTVTSLPTRRGPAIEAAGCHVESPESIERRRAAAEARALAPVLAPPTPGRPDKRTRRLLLRARDRR